MASSSAATPPRFALGSGRRATCPAGSQVGSVAAATPMLPALPGKVFLAQPAPGDDPGDVARLLVEIEQGTARDSLRVKFAMRIAIQAGTGRVRAILENLPKLPVSSFAFTFPGGSTPVIRQPRTCGAFEGQATMRPHGAGGSRTFAAPYLVDRNCGPVTDEPSLTVSPKQATAAASVPLSVAMRFPNGRAPAERLRVSLPQGSSRCSAACPSAPWIGPEPAPARRALASARCAPPAARWISPRPSPAMCTSRRAPALMPSPRLLWRCQWLWAQSISAPSRPSRICGCATMWASMWMPSCRRMCADPTRSSRPGDHHRPTELHAHALRPAGTRPWGFRCKVSSPHRPATP